jgi:phosphoserine phosphatase
MKSRLVVFALLFALLMLPSCSTNPASSNSNTGQPAATAAADPLPSWNDGAAKKAIVDFVRVTTDKSSPNFVRPEDRVATFDQDGTTWVEQPMYSQFLFVFDRIAELAPQHPEWKARMPYKAVLSGDKSAIARLSIKDMLLLFNASSTGMTPDEFQGIVRDWMAKARHPRFDRPYPEMVYQPMLEVMKYLRDNGYRTYIVTGGGQDFVRAYAQQVYGIAPEQIIGSTVATKFEMSKDGRATLIKEAKIQLDDNFSGKAEDIDLFIGKRAHIAFGNSTGDQQMLEYTSPASGASLGLLVLHDDAVREYAYGPAQGLPDSKVGTFTQALYDEAKARGWIVISMKDDWKQIFSWQK